MAKKIMFNDRYGLTQAVLEGRKTMTRRSVPKMYDVEWDEDNKILFVNTDYGRRPNGWVDIREVLGYRVGEIVAIAQKYSDVAQGGYPVDERYDAFRTANWGDGEDGALKSSAGWNNKMFVKSELMPHHIRITDVKVEQLQDISDDDCIREGIDNLPYSGNPDLKPFAFYDTAIKTNDGKGWYRSYDTLREAYAALIDRISGRGTWDSNPFVFVYEFELVD